MSWYIAVLKKYAVFNGRARRKEYWMFVLFNIIVSFVLSIIDYMLGTSIGGSDGASGMGVISGLYSLAVLIPSLAVLVRRLHDVGKSGWWVFISLIPLIGGIWLFILTVTNGQPGENKYGSNPKEMASAD